MLLVVMDALLSIGRSKARRLEGRVFYACRKSSLVSRQSVSRGPLGGLERPPAASDSFQRLVRRCVARSIEDRWRLTLDEVLGLAVQAALGDDVAAVGEA